MWKEGGRGIARLKSLLPPSAANLVLHERGFFILLLSKLCRLGIFIRTKSGKSLLRKAPALRGLQRGVTEATLVPWRMMVSTHSWYIYPRKRCNHLNAEWWQGKRRNLLKQLSPTWYPPGVNRQQLPSSLGNMANSYQVWGNYSRGKTLHSIAWMHACKYWLLAQDFTQHHFIIPVLLIVYPEVASSSNLPVIHFISST